jgi:hypothetical protein
LISGVAAAYNRSEYSRERQQALDAWGRYVEQLVYSPDKSNVVAMVQAR